ncbi:hypothetical protein [Endozoicomonas sp. Mp262]|uniref:hypothetical protein n=1 Tax=Endozoicomonas sp. Mp262 TaxID=2919499 RepID=UPI0021D9B226
MGIGSENIKLLESQRLTDEEDGGGRVTGNEIIDSNINNLFQDISRIDRTIGDVALRKAFLGVNTDNDDVYLGSHVILTDPPNDPNVSVLLFNTDSQTDERKDARNRIEAYVVPSTIASFELLGNQMAGQRSIGAVQREEQKLPEVGEVYRLLDEDTGNEQFIRVTAVEHALETFTYEYATGSYIDLVRRKVDMEIGSALAFNFPGGRVTPSGTTKPKSIINATQVADAAKYYSIQPTKADIAQGDLSVKVRSVYAPLVPSARVESPLLDQSGIYTAKNLVPTSDSSRSVSCQLIHITGNQSRTFLQTGVLPGSVTLSLEGGTWQDDNKGGFIYSSGVNGFASITLDYETGELNVWRNSSYSTGQASVTYTPATAVVGAAISSSLEITNQNRGFNYTLNLAEAKPKPGTLAISFIALNKWQDLIDPGNGLLEGSGTGTMDFATGSVSLTLDAMPDPDSAIVFNYVAQNDDEMAIHTGDAVADAPSFIHVTEKPGIKPGSLTVTYISSTETKTLTDQGNGVLSGDGHGTVYYVSGELGFKLEAMPDSGTEIEISYEQGEVAGGNISVAVDGAGMMTGTISGAPLLPGSVSLQFMVERDSNVPNTANTKDFQSYTTTHQKTKTLYDDTAGGWQGLTGTLDYQTGAFSVQAIENYDYTEYTVTGGGTLGGASLASTTVTKTELFTGSTVIAKAQDNSLSHSAYTETISNPELTIDLLPLIADPLLPGSLIFSWQGDTYFDRDGLLYKSVSTATNAGINVGTIDYTGGMATLASYPDGVPGTVTIEAAATIRSGFKTDAVSFRTPGAPIRIGSLQLTAIRADNAEIITATADFNGAFNTAEVQGKIDTATGWCELQFTDGAESIYVIPQSIRYNCVVETNLPLDAGLIGLDPVRLPPDGQVPVFRPGDIVVINHTSSTDLATPNAGQAVNLSRNHQAEIIIEDSDGTLLDTNQYTVDREAGQITFADPLSLMDVEGNPLTAPFTAKDRVEHMSVVSDVQINGELSIIAPVPWDLPAGETTVSSAVVYGDLQARVHHFYSQKVWDNGSPNWSDDRIGDQTTAQYNTINYPVEVTNKGAIDGRWAILFTSTNSFQVVEEKLGIIASGNTDTDTAPINPETNVPYFTLKKEGWGTGWSAGNAIRFNTDGCLAPLWICRTVLAGQGTEKNDRFTLQIRGDAD